MSRFPSTKSTQWKAISARPSVTLDIIRNLPCQRFSEEPLKHHRHHELSPTIPCISAGADYFESNIFFQLFVSNKRSSANHCKYHQSQNHKMCGCVGQVSQEFRQNCFCQKMLRFRSGPFPAKTRFVYYQFIKLVSDIVITGSMRWGKPKRISGFILGWYALLFYLTRQ